MPITYFILHKFSITVGANRNYKLDKAYILLVLIIASLSGTTFEIILVS